MARPSKYHFYKLLEIEQPAVGHFYGNVEQIRSAAAQWAKNYNVKIKTRKFNDPATNMDFIEVRVMELPPSAP